MRLARLDIAEGRHELGDGVDRDGRRRRDAGGEGRRARGCAVGFGAVAPTALLCCDRGRATGRRHPSASSIASRDHRPSRPSSPLASTMLAAALSSLSYNAPLVQGRSAVAVSRAAVAPTMNFLDDFKTSKPQKYDPMLGWIDDDSDAAAGGGRARRPSNCSSTRRTATGPGASRRSSTSSTRSWRRRASTSTSPASPSSRASSASERTLSDTTCVCDLAQTPRSNVFSLRTPPPPPPPCPSASCAARRRRRRGP